MGFNHWRSSKIIENRGCVNKSERGRYLEDMTLGEDNASN